ncbi:hypothetical protein BC936DRAFT_136915, partial [Jimgerdemannia flammicorona]
MPGISGGGGAHAVAVVLAYEGHGQVPQLGHVVGLEHLTLVGGAVAVQRERDVVIAKVFLREGNAGADGDLCGFLNMWDKQHLQQLPPLHSHHITSDTYLSADDTVTAVEILCEHVHGPALALGDAILAAEQFGHDALNGTTAYVGKAVAAVGGDDMVVGRDGRFHADGDGFLLM